MKGGETKVKGSFVIHQDGPMSWWGLAAAQPACSPHRRAEGPGVEPLFFRRFIDFLKIQYFVYLYFSCPESLLLHMGLL